MRILFGFVLAAVIFGCIAGVGMLLTGDSWSPRNYVTAEGECFVPPQGDPLYDEHYAIINQGNCSAFVDQSQAFNLDAQTQVIESQNFMSQLGVGSLIFVIMIIIVLLVIAARAQ